MAEAVPSRTRSLTIALDLSVEGEVSNDEMAAQFIEWLLDITDAIETPTWLVSFDGAEPRRF